MTDLLAATLPLLEDPALTPTERVRRVVRVHIELNGRLTRSQLIDRYIGLVLLLLGARELDG